MPEGSSEKVERKKIAGATSETVNFKWGGAALLDEGFVPFPKRLLRNMVPLWAGSREIGQLAVLLAIVDYRRPTMGRLPSVGVLAFIAGMEPDEFEARLKELESAGFIEVGGNPEALQITLRPLVEAITEGNLGEE